MLLLNDNEQPRLDYERLQQLHGDSRSMLIVALDLFLDEVLGDFLALEHSVHAHDWNEVAGMAHRLIPWLGMVGLTQQETQLRRLMAQARQPADPVQLTRLWQQFKTDLDQMVPLVEAERKALVDSQ